MIAIEVWRIAWCSRKDYDKKLGNDVWRNSRKGLHALAKWKTKRNKELLYYVEIGEVKI
jgi:hypothetical protein